MNTFFRYPLSMAATAALILFVQPVHAQEISPLDTLKIANQAITRFTLDNGMTCLIKEDHSAPVVAVQIWVGTGSIHEGKYLGSGLSHAIEHMIFKGTPTRAVGSITREINEAGGSINAHTSYDRTVFHTVMPSAKWEVGLDVLSDAVMHASFPKEEWLKEKEVIVREMAMGKDSPQRVLSKLLWQTAYSVHPFKHPIIGYEDVFRARSREDLADFFRSNYTPDNMITVVVGDITPSEVKKQMSDVFADFKRTARAPVVLPVEPQQISARKARKTGAYEVSRLLWSYPTVPLQHPDTAVLDVLSSIVGEGNSSRLVHELRENKQLVYEIGAWSWTPKEPGLFAVNATFAPNKEAEIIAAVQDEIDSWSTSTFSEKEVQKVKRMILVNELSQLQTMEGQANSIASGQFYAGDPKFSERYLELVDQVTPESLTAAVKKYLTPDKRTIAILAPEEPSDTAQESIAAAALEMPIQKRLMKNGIPLIIQEDHRLPFVTICIAIRGGLLSESETNGGVTRLMADLLTRGTASHTAASLAEETEQLGASLEPFSGDNSFGLQLRCLSEDTDKILALAAECLLSPTFPESEIEKLRAEQIAAIGQQHEQPFFLARQSLKKALFAQHPYQGDVLGTEESVTALTRDDLLTHFRQLLARENVVVSIFGHITPDQAQLLAEQYLSAIPNTPSIMATHAAPTRTLPARLEQRQPKEQAIMLVGFPGLDVSDPKADSLLFLQTAFSGLSSTLGVEVREKRGLVYYVGALQRMGVEPGYFAFYAGTREDAVPELEELIKNEIQRVTETGLSDEEIARVREQLLGHYQMQRQDTSYMAQICALNELYGLGYDYLFTFEDRINGLTGDQIRTTAQSIFKADSQVLSLVLPENNTEE